MMKKIISALVVVIVLTSVSNAHEFPKIIKQNNAVSEVMVMHRIAYRIMDWKSKIRKYIILNSKRGQRAVIVKPARRVKKVKYSQLI